MSWTVSSGAPDNSNWPPGSSEIAPSPVPSARPMRLPTVDDRLPAEALLHAGEEGANAALALVGHGSVVRAIEGEFLVLGADAIGALRLAAFLDPGDELVAALDRRRVRDVARHADCSSAVIIEWGDVARRAADAITRPPRGKIYICASRDGRNVAMEPDARETHDLVFACAQRLSMQRALIRPVGLQSPRQACTRASAATAAVSARMMRGPSERRSVPALRGARAAPPRQSRLPAR